MTTPVPYYPSCFNEESRDQQQDASRLNGPIRPKHRHTIPGRVTGVYFVSTPVNSFTVGHLVASVYSGHTYPRRRSTRVGLLSFRVYTYARDITLLTRLDQCQSLTAWRKLLPRRRLFSTEEPLNQ